MNISPQEKKELLDKILNSSEFKDSKRYQDLLTYLVNRTDETESVKEVEIAHDLFGKDTHFDPSSNPLIRSYISNLRKKLEHYYLTSDDKFTYRIEIPKGQYKIIYTKENLEHAKSNGNFLTNKFFISVIAVLLIVILLQILLRSNLFFSKQNESNLNIAWNEFVKESSHPTTIVLGDYLFLVEKNRDSNRIFIRDPKINSATDLKNFQRSDPRSYSNFELLQYTYLRPSAHLGLSSILKSLGSINSKINIKLSSELKWEDFDNHNIIYIGSLKTLYKLDTLIAKTNIRYTVEPSTLILNSNTDNQQKFDVNWQASNYQKDYSAIIKIPGSKDNTVMLLTGFSEIGVMESVKSVLDQNLIQRIEKFSGKNIDQQPFYFELISQTEGVELTSFKAKINYFKQIMTK